MEVSFDNGALWRGWAPQARRPELPAALRALCVGGRGACCAKTVQLDAREYEQRKSRARAGSLERTYDEALTQLWRDGKPYSYFNTNKALCLRHKCAPPLPPPRRLPGVAQGSQFVSSVEQRLRSSSEQPWRADPRYLGERGMRS